MNPAWTREGDELVHNETGLVLKAAQERLLQDLPEDAMPSRPRGDAKERMFNLLVRDGIDPSGSVEEEALIGKKPDSADRAFAQNSQVATEFPELLGEILDDHYVIEAKGGVRFLFPFQSYLPGTFEFHGRYKMFNGKILAFLCQPCSDGRAFNEGLISRFYEVFNGRNGLSLLDDTVLGIAREAARDDDDAAREAVADQLISRHYGDPATAPGALLPDAHERFQSDLEAILSLETLNRRDVVNAALNVFYVHLALYFQRLAWLLEEELSLCLRALGDPGISIEPARACFGSGLAASPFAGTLKFRVGTGQPTPIRMTDEAAASYLEHNRRQLLLPVNLSVLGAARRVMAACGRSAERWTFSDFTAACRENPELNEEFGEGLSLIAQATVAEYREEDRADIRRQVEAGTHGLEVLREALLKIGRPALRRHGRDIVHQLVHRGGRGYISRRGSVFFFEIGQDLLLLLAKVIVREKQMPYREFVGELRCLGLAPQSPREEEQLADTLRVLNLLEKHSDAGEAMYVKHFL